MEAIENAVDDSVTMVYIQRSRGYELRPSLLVDEIGEIVKVAKKKNPNVIIMVDNCYGANKRTHRGGSRFDCRLAD